MPPVTPPQSIVIDLTIVTPLKPPGSRQLISPFAAVFEIAPAKVLHGAVRLHGLASLQTPETQMRVCACACEAYSKATKQRSRDSGGGILDVALDHDMVL